MKESQFRQHAKRVTMDELVQLAKEAGATFEPEMVALPNFVIGGVGIGAWLAVPGPGYRWDEGYPTQQQLTEVLRRCKAVEEAIGLLRDHPSSEIDPLDAKLLAILEGTK